VAINCDLDAEVLFFRVLCSQKTSESLKAKLLSSIDDKSFGYLHSKEVYQRVMSLIRRKAEYPLFLDILNDPVISEDARSFFRERAPKKLKITRQLLRSMKERLATYRKIRGAIEVATILAKGVLKPGVDLDSLLETSTTKLNEIKVASLGDEKVYHFGQADNTDGVVSRVMNNVTDDLYTTGFSEYDSRNGGFSREGLVILAGTTSGGKSVLANMLLKHIYLTHNVSTIKVTMEMSEFQETRRLMSHLARIPYSKFTQSQLTPGDVQNIRKKREAFKKHGVDNDCRFSIWAPQSSINLDKALLIVRPYEYKVIAIDYITLLDEKSTKNNDAQWQVLSDIARRCKVYSRNTKTLVILLAQLDEDTDKVRYSRALKEHADFVWVWNYTKKENRDSRIIQMKNQKARDMEVFNFEIAERFDIMTLENLGESSSEESSAESYNTDKQKKPANKTKAEEPQSPDSDELNLDDSSNIDYDQNGMY
jgi:hypothetical protein